MDPGSIRVFMGELDDRGLLDYKYKAKVPFDCSLFTLFSIITHSTFVLSFASSSFTFVFTYFKMRSSILLASLAFIGSCAAQKVVGKPVGFAAG